MSVFKTLFILVISTFHISLLLSANSHTNRNGLRITNGQEAVPHSLPFMVAIRTTIDDRAVLCGGTLVSQHFVLTAAKCIDGSTSAELILGAHDITAQEDTQVRITVTSESYIVHEAYEKETLYSDIALILFSDPITLTDNIKTISLPTVADMSKTYDGDTAVIAGWGKVKDTTSEPSKVLERANVTILPLVDCELDNLFPTLTADQMCSSGVRKINICLGDNGGPLIVEGVQVGISSYGSDYGCEVGIPAVYTRLTSFINWLNSSATLHEEHF